VCVRVYVCVYVYICVGVYMWCVGVCMCVCQDTRMCGRKDEGIEATILPGKPRQRNRGNDAEMSAKGPYISAKKPCISAKEHDEFGNKYLSPIYICTMAVVDTWMIKLVYLVDITLHSSQQSPFPPITHTHPRIVIVYLCLCCQIGQWSHVKYMDA